VLSITLKEPFFFFREIFAFVDTKLSLWFDATTLACVLSSKKRGELKERAFGTKSAHVCSPIGSSSFGIPVVQ